MNDNNEKYKIELSNEEYEFIAKIREDLYNKLSLMSTEERLQYFRKFCYEKDLNFEKEINGTIYKVKNFFNDNDYETLVNKVSRLLEKDS